MQTFIIIFAISWIIPILFTLVNAYRNIRKGSTIKDLFSRLHWQVLIPVLNIVIFVIYVVMSLGRWFLNIRIK